MILSGIHDFNGLQSGFPIKIASGMIICENIKDGVKGKDGKVEPADKLRSRV